MIRHQALISALMLFLSLASQSNCFGQLAAPYFYDDFEDGSTDDAKPVTWKFHEWTQGGTKSVRDGSLIVAPDDVPNDTPGYDRNRSEANIYPENRVFQDVSLRVQFRVLEEHYSQIVPVLRDHLGDDGVSGSLIWAGVETDGGGGIGSWTPDGNADSGVSYWGTADTFPYKYAQTEMRMKVDHFGRDISLTVWAVDEEMPREPQVVVEVPDDEFVEPGRIALSVLSDLRQGVVPVAFRYIAALPTSYLAGDFDDDGQLTSKDLDLLTSETLSTRDWWNFDLDHDGNVEPADRITWIHQIKKTHLGDSDLDGAFDSRDLVAVFQRGQFEDQIVGNSKWEDGDWNGDREFTTADFVSAFQDGGYGITPPAHVSTVPEPTGNWVVYGLLFGAGNLRQWRFRRVSVRIVGR